MKRHRVECRFYFERNSFLADAGGISGSFCTFHENHGFRLSFWREALLAEDKLVFLHGKWKLLWCGSQYPLTCHLCSFTLQNLSEPWTARMWCGQSNECFVFLWTCIQIMSSKTYLLRGLPVTCSLTSRRCWLLPDNKCAIWLWWYLPVY